MVNNCVNCLSKQSYKERNALIMTQMPLESTKHDFWVLVRDYAVHTIVMMNTVSEAEVSFRSKMT